jgi:hypothetical protein
MRIFLYLLLFTVLLSCTTQKNENSAVIIEDVLIAFSEDGKGVFIYSPDSKKTEQVLELKKTFLPYSLEFQNDFTLNIGYKGEQFEEVREKKTGILLECPCTPEDSNYINGVYKNYKFNRHEIYNENYITIDLYSKKFHEHKSIKFTHIEFDTLKIDTSFFDQNGLKVMTKDTVFQCSQSSRSYKQRKFCEPERFYSKSNKVNGKTVYSRNGNLYLTWLNTDTLLLESQNHFDPKFGTGYYEPNLSADGKSLLFRKLGGLSLFGDNGKLIEMDIVTREVKTVLDQTCISPQYSSNGKFIVYQYKKEIYLYEIATKKKKKVGAGDLFSVN